MKEINIIDIVKSRYPNFLNNYPNIIKKIIYILIEKILYLNEINKFLKLHSNRKSFDFIEELFDYLDFSYMISDKDKQKIPIEGRLIVVSNHPLGSLDGLALLKSISQIRPDTKIIANDILEYITPLKDLIIPFNIESFKIQKENILKIEESLKKEECLIFFPAAEVSRLRYNGIKDSKWNKGPIYFAKKLNSPILPVFIKGRNTLLFYLISIISKSFSKLLLPREMFKQKGKTIEIKVGDFIPNRAFNSDIIDIKTELKLLKKHVYRLGSNKKLIFVTEKNIISPVEKSILKKEIKNLSSIVNFNIVESRQHFLKLEFPQTYRNLINNNISSDYTMGYASEVGFRAGISRPFYFFDIDADVETKLRIHPFCIMDSTLKNYKNYNPEEAIENILPVINSVKLVKGNLITVWHNESFGGYAVWKGWETIYENLLNIILS